MLVDEIREQLKSIEPDIQVIASYWQHSDLEKRYQELLAKTDQEDSWRQPELAKELQRIRTQKDEYEHTIRTYQELLEIVELFAHDEQELIKLSHDVKALRSEVTSFKIALLLHDPQDTSNCFMTINSGAGGTESQDWANILSRMYIRFCERNKFSVEVLDLQQGEEAGIKSITLFIKGKNPYGLLKSEHGVHRLVRISPFDSNKRRHTSFAGVAIAPEVPEVEITINPDDLRIDTYRSGGAGGQHVNKTESAIRITHIPTNTVVQCQNERSQGQNKINAMKMLRAKLAQRQRDEEEAKRASVKKEKIEWGSQIRSYVLHPYKMVKDHRTDHESPQPDLVLDGDLMDFIESYLVWQAKAT